MPSVGFEPTIPVFEQVKTVHASDYAATVTGKHELRTMLGLPYREDGVNILQSMIRAIYS
jgi:hypothetical protein